MRPLTAIVAAASAAAIPVALLAQERLDALQHLGQGSLDGDAFLRAVRQRDGPTTQRIVNTPGSTAINYRESSTGEAALHILVRGRDLTWLSFLLSRGARPDTQSHDGTTPLILSARLNWHDGAGQLLARGANPNLGNQRGETPLIIAVQNRDISMVRLLLSARADPNQTDAAGHSSIYYALQDPLIVLVARFSLSCL